MNSITWLTIILFASLLNDQPFFNFWLVTRKLKVILDAFT